jgi:hypothetical protein
MKMWSRLLLASLLLSLGGWGQTGREDAPKSRHAHPAGVHKTPGHAARQLSEREKRENASLRAEKRREAKLAKKQRKEAKRRSRRTRQAGLKNQTTRVGSQ